jgi:hypothetical protein
MGNDIPPVSVLNNGSVGCGYGQSSSGKANKRDCAYNTSSGALPVATEVCAATGVPLEKIANRKPEKAPNKFFLFTLWVSPIAEFAR